MLKKAVYKKVKSCQNGSTSVEFDLQVWGKKAQFESAIVWPYLPVFYYLPLVFSGKICLPGLFGKPDFFILLFPCLFKEQEIVRSSGNVGGVQIFHPLLRKDN